MKKEIENRLNDIKEKARVTDKYLNQIDIEWTEEDLSDLLWLIEKVERYEKALDEISRQYENTSVNRSLEIAKEALEGEK